MRRSVVLPVVQRLSAVVCVVWLVMSGSTSECCVFFFFFKQKTAYEMRISDWSSDVCSSDLRTGARLVLDVGWLERPPAHLTPRRYELGCFQIQEIGRASCRERVCQYV